MRVAAIDVGTVTSRLLIADVCQGAIHPLVRRAEITNLGEGVDQTGMLSSRALERTINQIKDYKACIDSYAITSHPVQSIVAVATSASRDAGNANEFESALASLGIELSVIPGKREAELSFLGAAHDFQNKDLLVVDIGGGSTELICGKAQRDDEHFMPRIELLKSHSFNVGCRRMTERFLTEDPPSAESYRQARQWVHNQLCSYFDAVACHREVIAVAGTATTAVSIREKMSVYNPDRVHGSCMTRGELSDICQHLAFMSLSERRNVVGLQPERASVIVAGFVILDVILSLVGQDVFTVSESDILQGLVLEAVAQKMCSF